ncbi:hypothetical protein [Sphingomonas oryzagri]|uniref:Uncharacterized protein n=1 Tax=Sphingomonas oryzagri TaxID=3042314 RepID=A0ABT6N0U7_9SPHN|nr:hypothetical protein [Sphingomonas oryzagri]MDH7638924.1 hypothetical protein [Sphingomonas oryzagri]
MGGQHTPGPWEIGQTSTYEEALVAPKSGRTVAYAAWDGGSGCHLAIENDADAQLIAAAPDLLEALNWLREFWRPGSNHDTREVEDALATADAAIAKALSLATVERK